MGTILENEETFIRFFHPRKHNWHEHFEIEKGEIIAKTPIGVGTIKILDFNDMERVMERLFLTESGQYPGTGD